jgi:hypothetical protein
LAHDVFVSYSFKDKIIADTIVAALEDNQIRCWYAPRDIKPSQDWAEAITKGIEEAKIFLIIFSGNANHSQRVLDELNLAISQQAVILPFRVENLEPEGAMKLHLSSRHWLDAYKPSWNNHITKLVNTVADNLGTVSEQHAIEKLEKTRGKDKKQQRKKALRIAVAIGLPGAIIAGWFGWTAWQEPRQSENTLAAANTESAQVRLTQAAEESNTTTMTSEPSPEPTLPDSSIELGEPDYATDFSSYGLENQAWAENAEDADGFAFLNRNDGTLVVHNYDSFLYSGEKRYINTIIETDVKLTEFTSNEITSIQLTCRMNQQENYSELMGYRAFFTSTGEVIIDVVHTPRTIGSGISQNFQKYKYNRLRFDCIGSEFRAYVNGELIASGTDSTFYSGNIGVNTDNESGSGSTTAEFDTFRLWIQ